MRTIIIKSAGLLTTIQDCGRIGYQRYGMPVCGAMDLLSLQLANLLVGNRPDTAALEVTLTGPEIVFSGETVFAICGADLQPSLNGRPIANNQPFSAADGDILTFGSIKSGCRAYIAFNGGFDLPPVMGSYATYLRAKVGGYCGRALQAGDQLRLNDQSGWKKRERKIPDALLLNYQTCQRIRIVPGPEVRRLDFEAIKTLLTCEFQVSGQSDRMGLRLSGEAIRIKNYPYDIISAGTTFGTIQLPADGQPIILMADRQTTGGYARIAVVISVDHPLLAQLKVADRIKFQEVSIEKAQEELRERFRLLESLSS